MAIPIVSIVGRSNVGKSTLFNKILGNRVSIVDNSPGVTRDRLCSKTKWLSHTFYLMDTGGLELTNKDSIMLSIKDQVQFAIENATVIIFLVNLKAGVTSLDIEIAHILRKVSKPVVFAVNKCDSIGIIPVEFYEFYKIYIDNSDPMPISSMHGHGLGDLLDEVVKYFPKKRAGFITSNNIKIAIVGRPNVGKSSLLNKLAGENRAIVSNIPGTTRDPVTVVLKFNNKNYELIDTAGFKRKSTCNNLEKYSIIRSMAAIDEADVCVLMIDATQGFTDQDCKIAGHIVKKGKAIVVLINKWDLIEKDSRTINVFNNSFRKKFNFLSYAPVIYISVKDGTRINKLNEYINFAFEQSCKRISTSLLNNILTISLNKSQPPAHKGRQLKIYYITQVSVKPPTFAIFLNDINLLHFSYKRYIENEIRSFFNFKATPIRLISRERRHFS